MELTQQLKEFEKEFNDLKKKSEMNEKEAKFYKDRYEALRSEASVVLNKFSVLLTEKVPGVSRMLGIDGRRRTSRGELNEKMDEAVMKVYGEMKVNQKKYNADKLGEVLGKVGVLDNPNNRQLFRNALFKEPGITYKRESQAKILYYDEKKLEKNEDAKRRQKELIEKFGQTIITEKVPEPEVKFGTEPGGVLK